MKMVCQLIQPPGNEYNYYQIGIHGITAKDTKDKPTFKEYWPTIEPYIKDHTVVAHGMMTFENTCIKQALEYYNMAIPDYTMACTSKIYNAKLDVTCKQCGIKLKHHHNALEDARACSELYIKHLAQLRDNGTKHDDGWG